MTETSPQVLIVANKPGNAKILATAMEERGYAGLTATSEAELDAQLDAGVEPDVALVDVSGFGRQIWHWCERLQLKGVPFVVISARDLTDVELNSTRSGARSVFRKPIRKSAIMAIVDDIVGAEGGAQTEDPS